MRRILKLALIITIVLIFAFSSNPRIATIRNYVITLSQDVYDSLLGELKAIDNENVNKVVEVID